MADANRIDGYHKGKTFEVGNHYLADGAVLEDCRLVLRESRHLSIGAIRLVGCQVESARWAMNLVWCSANMEGCRFLGRYRGNDFGGWPGGYEPVGSIKGCDFSNAELDCCRIFADNADVVRLPAWPHFGLCRPWENGPRIHRQPGLDGRIKFVLEGRQPREVALVVLSAAHTKWLREIDRENLLRELRTLGEMVIIQEPP